MRSYSVTLGKVGEKAKLNNVAKTADHPPPDHRVIATAQQLLSTSVYSPGSPLFLPHGTRIYNKLVEFLRSQYARYGFQEVLSPTIYKRSLWEVSGHWENYRQDMFEVKGGPETENPVLNEVMEEFGLKPMNCPGHCLMFKATAGSRSLRDFPVRYADFSPLHRNENSGSLSGLTRVRRFHQDDGHIFCRPIQIAQEISSTLEFIRSVYDVFRLPTPRYVFSTRPENHIGEVREWDRAEAALRQALDASRQPWSLNDGDGAFYGPKIDVMVEDSDGKQHQTATVQLDFQLPQRFNLEYLAPAHESERNGILSEDPAELAESGYVRPVIIHRAVMGSLERFMALLIEHYSGKWPFWLSPRQAMVIPVTTTDEKVVEYAQSTQEFVSGAIKSGKAQPMSRRTFNVDVDLTSNSLAKKIKMAKTNGYNVVIVVGERNLSAGTVSVNMGGTARLPVEQQKQSKAVEMTPAETYDLFVMLEDEYA